MRKQSKSQNYRRIVVKIGSNLLTTKRGLLNRKRIKSLTDQIYHLKQQGLQVILVSSGSVSAGRGLIEIPGSTEAVAKRQVLSAIGQVKLMESYLAQFKRLGYLCGQVLASKGDFRDRHHYINMRKCIESLLAANVIPVINENDTVSVTELMFTDNDELTGLIAGMLDVDAVFLLTDVDGIYSSHPSDPQAKIISSVDPTKEDVSRYIFPVKSEFGRGGMVTKTRVAVKLSKLGIATHILNGTRKDCLTDFFTAKKLPGTTFIPHHKVSTIKKWISYTAGQQKGMITINRTAEKLLPATDKARSLLPIGVTHFEGEFKKGDILQIQSETGNVIGYGIAQYSSDKLKECMGKKGEKPLIHYDYLYLEPS